MGGDALTPAERLAVWGGYIQGEGCLCVSTGSPRVHVSNTYRRTLEELQGAFGGTIRVASKAHGGYRTCYEWYICGQRAINLILSMRKYLGEKGEQADAIVEWYKAGPRTARRAALAERITTLKRIDYGE